MPPKTSQLLPSSLSANGPSTSVLDRMRPVKDASSIGQLKVSIYGTQGTGKTRLAATFPKPILFIAPEVGEDSIRGVTGIDYAPMESATEIWTLLEVAKGQSRWVPGKDQWNFLGLKNFTGQRYRTVVLDTATKLRIMQIRELWHAQGKEVPKAPPPQFAGKEWKDVWNQSAYNMTKMLGAILDLPRTHDLNVVVCSQEANTTYDEGGSQVSSEILRPNIASQVGKSVSDFLNAECSYVGQMMIRAKYEERVTKVGDLEDKVLVQNGCEYVMRVGPDPVYRTKFRRPPHITEPLPDFIPNPTFEKIVKVIKGEKL